MQNCLKGEQISQRSKYYSKLFDKKETPRTIKTKISVKSILTSSAFAT